MVSSFGMFFRNDFWSSTIFYSSRTFCPFWIFSWFQSGNIFIHVFIPQIFIEVFYVSGDILVKIRQTWPFSCGAYNLVNKVNDNWGNKHTACVCVCVWVWVCGCVHILIHIFIYLFFFIHPFLLLLGVITNYKSWRRKSGAITGNYGQGNLLLR